ncbi:hypothetical protein CCP2SC5_190044 [Azospirillaceae bacterium]
MTSQATPFILNAFTSSEAKQRAQKLTLEWGVRHSRFGPILAARAMQEKSNIGLCWLGFVLNNDHTTTLTSLRKMWPSANLQEVSEEETTIMAPFENLEPSRKIQLLVHGSDFRIQVWRALLEIPRGQTRSYGEIAQRIGAPQASRAVGQAVGSNPISILIPCHRVISRSGDIHHYHWGVDIKKSLLRWEAEFQPSK